MTDIPAHPCKTWPIAHPSNLAIRMHHQIRIKHLTNGGQPEVRMKAATATIPLENLDASNDE